MGARDAGSQLPQFPVNALSTQNSDSLILSLSHTHIHAHAHTRACTHMYRFDRCWSGGSRERGRMPGKLASAEASSIVMRKRERERERERHHRM